MKEYKDLQSVVTVLAYHFWGRDGYDEMFAKVEHAFRETWRYCGRLKSLWWRFFLNPKSRFFFEDTFYTLTACLGWGYRHGLKFAGEKDAFTFTFDSLKDLIAKPKGIASFGVYGR